MKYWQLMSIATIADRQWICRTAKSRPEWRVYEDWTSRFPQLVSEQKREVLDALVDTGFVETVLFDLQRTLFLSQDGWLRARLLDPSDREISLLNAFRRYGGDVMVEVFELGPVNVSNKFDVSFLPKQTFLCLLISPADDPIRAWLQDVVAKLAASRTWVVGPPVVVDAADAPDDEAIEASGLQLEIVSAQSFVELPKALDQRQFVEVAAVVECLRLASQERGVSFECEIDGRYVGLIERGSLNRKLANGLLGEWERHLESSG
jgi:hypothetical protein